MKIVPPYLNDMSCKLKKELDRAIKRKLKAKAKYDAACAYCEYCKEQLKTVDETKP